MAVASRRPPLPDRLMIMDLVCAHCGSDLVYVEVGGVKVPDRCSNERCPYSEGGEVGAWTAQRSVWQPERDDDSE